MDMHNYTAVAQFFDLFVIFSPQPRKKFVHKSWVYTSTFIRAFLSVIYVKVYFFRQSTHTFVLYLSYKEVEKSPLSHDFFLLQTFIPKNTATQKGETILTVFKPL